MSLKEDVYDQLQNYIYYPDTSSNSMFYSTYQDRDELKFYKDSINGLSSDITFAIHSDEKAVLRIVRDILRRRLKDARLAKEANRWMLQYLWKRSADTAFHKVINGGTVELTIPEMVEDVREKRDKRDSVIFSWFVLFVIILLLIVLVYFIRSVCCG